MDNKSDLNLFIQTEKLQSLYKQSFPALFIGVITATLVIFALWSVQNHDMLLFWLLAVVLAAVMRLTLFIRYNRAAPQGNDLLKWEKPYLITHIIATSIWGLGAVWVMPKDSLLHQVVVYAFIMGMAGGALSVYSSHRLVTLIAVINILVPISVWFFLSGYTTLTTSFVLGAVLFILSAMRATGYISTTQHQNATLTYQLQLSNKIATQQAHKDELTSVFNRRGFYESVNTRHTVNQRGPTEFSLILLDIDQFKQINDNFGLAIGDAALQHLARITQQTIRSTDICARLGGDEFIVLLPNTPLNQAEKIAEKLRAAIANTPLQAQDKTVYFTVSLGIASGRGDFDAVLQRSDKALYHAKSSGRNQVSKGGAAIKSEQS